ncbi:MAG: transposase family protein [Nannocystis sp.]|nr:transposase family protein [Nannocystis sp.]
MIGPDGVIIKCYLLSQIDVASRFVPLQILFERRRCAPRGGLRRAIVARGAPRTTYVDLGAAYVAASLKQICAELAIFLLHAGPGDAAARGVIRRFHKAWRAEVGAELPSYPLPLAELNRPHRLDDLQVPQARPSPDRPEPHDRFLAGAEHLRHVPQDINIDGSSPPRATYGPRRRHDPLGGRLLRGPRRVRRREGRAALRPAPPDLPLLLYVDGVRVTEVFPLNRLANPAAHAASCPAPGPPRPASSRAPSTTSTTSTRRCSAPSATDRFII